MATIKTSVYVDESKLQRKLDDLLTDDVMLQVQNLFAKFCDPYVPKDEGPLSQTLEITPHYVRYLQPYAHYMYEGIVYGPNVPIVKDGRIVGWYSPIAPKYNTGRSINYSKRSHPLATSHWDKVMMQDRRDSFIKGIEDILKRKARELDDD